jgi:hypothetical protein
MYCYLFTQARNAQRSGAAGVLIADNTCLCSDEACTAVNPGMSCEMQEPIMADDGTSLRIRERMIMIYIYYCHYYFLTAE